MYCLIEKTNLSSESTTFNNFFIQQLAVCWSKKLFGDKTKLFQDKTKLFHDKTKLFHDKTKLFHDKTNSFLSKQTLFDWSTSSKTTNNRSTYSFSYCSSFSLHSRSTVVSRDTCRTNWTRWTL
jgi:hypothetical protein